MRKIMSACAVAAAACVALPVTASAGGDIEAAASKIYISGNLGAGWAPKFKIVNRTDSANWSEIKSKTGVAVGAAMGYRFTDMYRAELAIRYHHNKSDTYADEDNTAYTNVDGKLKSWSFMVNGIYDFDADMGGLKPFVGLGIGIAKPKFSLDSLTAAGTAVTSNLDWAGKTRFAYNAIIGANYALNSEMAVGIDYRYLGTVKRGFDYHDADSGTVNNLGRAKYQNHSVNLGVTFNIG